MLITTAKKRFATLIKDASVFLLFLGIAIFAFRNVLFTRGIIGVSREWMIPPFSGQVKQFFESDLYAWKPAWDFGSWSGSPTGLYYDLFLYSLASVGMDGAAISKFISIFALTFAGGSMFYLCKKMRIRTIPSILSGIFYMLAPPVFDLVNQGHVHILLDYALAPLALAFFRDSLKSKHNFGFLALTSILVLIASNHLSSFVLLFTMFLVVLVIHSINQRSVHSLFLSLRNLVILFGIAFVLHGYLIDVIQEVSFHTVSARMGNLPSKFIGVEGYNSIEILRLLRPGYMFFLEVAKAWQPWLILSFLPAIIAFAACLLKPKDERIVSFAVLGIIGITVASGSKGLFGSLWPWLVENVSVMRIFRDPSKFISLMSLGYAVLIGLFLEAFRERSTSLSNLYIGFVSLPKFKMKAVKVEVISTVFIFLLTSSAIFSYSWPLLTGDFGGTIQTYDFDEKYEELWHWLSEEPNDFRVLMLPAPYPIAYDDQKWEGLGSMDVMSLFAGKSSLYVGKNYGPQFVIFLFKTLYENRTEELGSLLGISNVKYVIMDLNKHTTSTELSYANLYFPEMLFTNEKLLQTLNQQKSIESFDAKESILIWENENYLPHIFPVNKIGLLAGDLDALISISYARSLELQDSGLIFADQLSNNDLATLNMLPNMKVIIQQGHFLDLVLARVSGDYAINPIGYVNESSPYEGWAPMFWFWYNWYYQAPLERVVFTKVPSILTMPYSVSQNGNYDVFLKLYFGPQASTVKIYLDDEQIGDINTKTPYELGFNWVHLSPIYLQQGNRHLKIESSEGENVIARVNIVPENVVNEALEATVKLLSNREVVLISKLRFENVTEYVWIKDAEDLLQVFQNETLTRRWPRGDPYSIDIQNEALILNLYFNHDASVSEAFTAELPAYPPVDLKTYQNFEIRYNVDDAEKTYFLPLLLIDYNGDNKTDAWFRIIPTSMGERKRMSLRDDGIYDIWFPLTPYKDSEGYSVFQMNLLEALKDFFPDKKTYNFTGIRFDFEKFGLNLTDANAKNYTFSLKHVKFYGAAWYSAEIGVGASEGFAMSSITTVPSNYSFYVPKSAFYRVYLRGSSETNSSLVAGKINSSEFSFLLNPLNYGFQWYEIGEVFLLEGTTNISFQPDGRDRIYLDQLLVTESLGASIASTTVANLTYQKINPAEYLISGQSSQPFYLVFSEAYHDSWKVSLQDGTKSKSYPAYSFGNLFFVNKTGNFEATLEFEGQRLHDITKYLSFSLFAVLILLLIVPSRLLKIYRIRVKLRRVQ